MSVLLTLVLVAASPQTAFADRRDENPSATRAAPHSTRGGSAVVEAPEHEERDSSEEARATDANADTGDEGREAVAQEGGSTATGDAAGGEGDSAPAGGGRRGEDADGDGEKREEEAAEGSIPGDGTGPAAASAQTIQLNPSHVGTDSRDHIEGGCDRVLWHFVLNGLDKGTEAGTLHVTFENAGEVVVSAGKVNLRMQHFYVFTSGHDVLLSGFAVAATEGFNNLNLSDVSCAEDGAEPPPDVTLDKEASVATVAPGGDIAYAITVRNEGSSAADVTVIDDFDETLVTPILIGSGGIVANGRIVWAFGLDAGEERVLTYTMLVDDGATSSDEVCNKACVSDGIGECPDDCDEVCVPVVPPDGPPPPPEPGIDLTIRKQASVEEAGPGDLIGFTLTYSNETTVPATDFTIVDDYDETAFEVIDAGGGTVTDGTIVWEIPGPLSAEDGERTLTYVVRVLSTVPTGTTLVCNTVVIEEPDDVDPTDNIAEECVTVRNPFRPFTPEPTETPTPRPRPFAPFTPSRGGPPAARPLPVTGADAGSLLLAAVACGTCGITLRRRSRRKRRRR